MAIDREVSKVVIANTKARSFRATIPKKAVHELNIDSGDFLEWKVETERSGEKYLKVKKLK